MPEMAVRHLRVLPERPAGDLCLQHETGCPQAVGLGAASLDGFLVQLIRERLAQLLVGAAVCQRGGDRFLDGTVRLSRARREFRNSKAAFKRFGL